MKTDNELIAEFMGLKLHESQIGNQHPHQTGYHTSWNWLMPVVSKCSSMDRVKTIDLIEYSWLLDGDIDLIYKAVVEFIKWYNTIQTQKRS